MRKADGGDCLARKAVEQIPNTGSPEKWIIDSIKNPAEIRYLRDTCRNFFLFGVYADRDVRWNRVHTDYDDNMRAFEEDDFNDRGDENPDHGQKVGECFSAADVVLCNNEHYAVVGNEEFGKLQRKVRNYVELVESPLEGQRPIHKREALMAMAYAASQRSSCMKRKVGAVIVDETGTAISSGFNEVPRHATPCKDKFRMCHRDYLCKQFAEELKEAGFAEEEKKEALVSFIRKRFKLLDNCQALHAEENAIVALARNGSSVALEDCTLYTTTYPCRLCANKIVETRIRRVVYLEPYPDEEAKFILKNDGVDDEFFEGVTFKAYFRIYGGRK